jgi:hypothetical protein
MVVEPGEQVSREAKERMVLLVRQGATAERYCYKRRTPIKQLAP